MSDYKYIVRTYCRTYNHEKYIRDALIGFSCQQTDFPVVTTIVEDCSTDKTADIIRSFLNEFFALEDPCVSYKKDTEYAHVVYSQHKHNKNCYFAVLFLKYNHHKLRKSVFPYIEEWGNNSKYFAICEGDDYWIDPLKLDKQVKVLNDNPKYSLVYTGFKTIDERGHFIVRNDYNNYMKESKTGWNFSHLLNHNYILTVTVCFRKELYDLPLYKKSVVQMDYSTFLLAASNGELYYIKDEMACYRKVGAGMMAQRNLEVQKKLRMIHEFYTRMYLDGELNSFPLKEKISIDISLTLFYIALFVKGYDKTGLFRLFKNKPICALFVPISLLYGFSMKICKPGYSIVNGVY